MEDAALESLRPIARWDYLASFEQVNGLSDEERLQILESISFLRKALGERFLEGALQARHPIFSKVANHAPWTRRWFGWFGIALQAFQSDPRFPKLKDKIIDPKKQDEALFLLEIGYMLKQAGFEVQLEVPVRRAAGRRGASEPDLKVTNPETAEYLFVECKSLSWSKLDTDAFRNFDRLSALLFLVPPNYLYSGRVLKTVATPTVEILAMKMRLFLERLLPGDDLQELNIPRALEFAVVPKSRQGALEHWAAQRNLQIETFEGARTNPDELRRLRERIGTAARQLPPDRANMVIVLAEHLRLTDSTLPHFIDRFEESVFEFPHIGWVVIKCPLPGPEEGQPITFDAHTAFKKTLFSIHTEARVLFINKFCSQTYSESTSSRLIRAFRDF